MFQFNLISVFICIHSKSFAYFGTRSIGVNGPLILKTMIIRYFNPYFIFFVLLGISSCIIILLLQAQFESAEAKNLG